MTSVKSVAQPSADAPSDTRESRGAPRRGRPLLFFIGLLIAAVGVAVLRSELSFGPLFPSLDVAPWRVLHGDAAVIGGLIAALGAAVAATAGRRWVPDHLGTVPLPPEKLRPDRIALLALAGGITAHGLLAWRLAMRGYHPGDAALFILGLALVGAAIWRSDRAVTRPPVTLPRRDLLAILAILAVTVGVNSIALTRWDFGWIGDEGAFFIAAKEIADTGRFNPFSLRGVYDTHPVLDSVYQGTVMKVLGRNVVGWRMSEVLILAASAAALYGAAALMSGRVAGVIGAVALGTSHYLMAFARIAYNNLHVVLYTSLVVLCWALAWRTQRAVFVFAAGMALGLCLYTLQVAMLFWPIAGIFLLTTLGRRPLVRALPSFLLMALGFAMVVTPALITTPPDRVLEVARQNTRREQALTNPAAVAAETLVDSALVFWTNHQWWHHYIGGPLLDPVTGTLAFGGLALAGARLTARANRLGVLWWPLGVGMLALAAYAPGPPFTRLLLVMPAAALLAGLTASALIAALSGGPSRLSRARPLAIAALLIAIPALNAYQLLVDSPNKLPSNRSAMILKALQDRPDHTIIHVGPWPRGDANVQLMVSWYPWLAERYQYASVAQIETGDRIGDASHPVVYLIDPEDPGVRDRVAAALGPAFVRVTDRDRSGRFEITRFEPAPAAR